MDVTIELMVACGHKIEFRHRDDDQYAEQKIAKTRGRPCRECRVAANELRLAEEKKAAYATKKIPSVRRLPVGAMIVIRKEVDGDWSGTLDASDRTAIARGDSLHGTIANLMTQAKHWFEAGYTVGPTVVASPSPPVRCGSKSVIDNRDQWKGRNLPVKQQCKPIVIRTGPNRKKDTPTE